MDIKDDALFLINRPGDKTYTIRADELAEELDGAKVLQPSITYPVNGGVPVPISGTYVQYPKTSEIVGLSNGGRTIEFTDDTDLSDFNVGDYVIQENSKGTNTGEVQYENYGGDADDGVIYGTKIPFNMTGKRATNFYGGSADFDTSGGITIGTPAKFSPGTGDFTYCFWQIHDLANTGRNNYAFNAGTTSGAPTTRVNFTRSGQSSPSDGSLSINVHAASARWTAKLGVWSHICAMRKNGKVYFFEDGELKTTVSLTGSANLGTTHPTIGNLGTSSPDTYKWNGGLQDFVYATRALFDEKGFTPPPQVLNDDGTLADWASGAEFVVPMSDSSVVPRGIVESVDVVGKKMTITSVSNKGPWGPVNDGHYVIGPGVSAPYSFKITSSDFESDPTGTLTHGSTDWEITDINDTGYANIIDSSYNDSVNLKEWEPNNVKGEKEYRTRVRYQASTGEYSQWSDSVLFETEEEPVLKADPGLLNRITGGTTSFFEVTGPLKIINFATSYNSVKAVGIDGKLYGCAATAGVLNQKSAAPDNIGAIAVGYDNTDANLNYMCYLFDDQTIQWNVTSSVSPSPPGETFRKIGTFGCVTNCVYAISTSDEVWVAGIGGKSIAGTGIIDGQWVKLNVTMPGGRKIKEICGSGAGNYDAPNILLLADDGTLWNVYTGGGQCPGLPTGTAAAPAQVSAGTTFTHINTAGGNYGAYGAISATDTDGNLWYAATAVASFDGTAYSWKKVPGQEGLWEEPVFGAYNTGTPLMGLRKDGYYWSNIIGTLNFFKVDGQTTPTTSSGTGRAAQNYYGAILWGILPD